MQNLGDKDFLGVRILEGGVAGPYKFESYAAVSQRVVNLAAFLQSLGLPKNSNIGLYSINRPEWVSCRFT